MGVLLVYSGLLVGLVAVSWRITYPGSALIRRMWLAAIKRRAEAVSSDSAL